MQRMRPQNFLIVISAFVLIAGLVHGTRLRMPARMKQPGGSDYDNISECPDLQGVEIYYQFV